MASNTKLWPYLVTFALAYLGLLILIGLIPAVFPVESINSLTIPALIAAAIIAAYRFVSVHKRQFTTREKHMMTLGSLLLSILVSLVLFTVILASPFGGEVEAALALILRDGVNSLPVLIPIVIIVLLLHWLALFLTYGWLTRRLIAR